MLISENSFLQKPSIKKHYGLKIQSGYPQNLIEYEQSILLSNIKKIQNIWSYVSVDLIRNNIDFLEIVDLPIDKSNSTWISQNIKLESFLNMIAMHYRKVGCISIETFIKDTFNQLSKLIDRKIEVSTPKRWRLIDFHDHVSYLYLKNTTKNNQLKTIIKPYMQGQYTLSQPKDTVSIIIWGKKVKNCVASYEERIGESIWIFFIEKDGIPYYTIETDLKEFRIKQMVSQSNQSVSDKERNMAQTIINNATSNKK